MRQLLLSLSLLLFLAGCALDTPTETSVMSPDGSIQISFLLDAKGTPSYAVHYGKKTVIDTSTLGMEWVEGNPMQDGFEIIEVSQDTFDEVWTPVWGEYDSVRNHFNEMTVTLKEEKAPNRKMRLVFRAYNDGVGFRYEFPEQPNLGEVAIAEEHTQFKLTGDHTTWWIPGDWDIYEHLYNTTPFSEIDALEKRDHFNLAQTYIPNNAVNTPVTMRTADGLHLSFHEANLTDYSGMTLLVDKENLAWKSVLVGSENGPKVKTQTPFHTPWRTVQISPDAAGLVASMLIPNLNEPCKIENTDWIKPTKYMGIWWEMHLEKSTWGMAGGRHGATTENAKRYIDFAAGNGIRGLLIEGWNTGWEKWTGEDREGIFDFVTPYPDFDIEEVVRYARERGVDIIGHHETSAAVTTYEQQMDTAFQFYKNLGIDKIKTGYVGKIIPKGEYHHGQYMVNHYRKVVEKAAEYGIMIDAHEPIKPTGIRRTWPNMMTREGVRGQEWNAWSSDMNPPEHLAILPFTRMLAGPIDFTPGIFNLKFDEYRDKNQVNTTLAKQLAAYVVIYSPMQMAADLPEHYIGSYAFQFIRRVPVDWDDSRILNGEVGDYITVARKQKGKENWFIGALTDENPRQLELRFDFLKDNTFYNAWIYKDGADAHWDDNPRDIDIKYTSINKQSVLTLDLAPGGGAAISLFAINPEENR
jgi:hypothetical protein